FESLIRMAWVSRDRDRACRQGSTTASIKSPLTRALFCEHAPVESALPGVIMYEIGGKHPSDTGGDCRSQAFGVADLGHGIRHRPQCVQLPRNPTQSTHSLGVTP